jgi:hypothetical protein
MFICGVVSLLFWCLPLVLLFSFLFCICYYAIQYDGVANAKHHVIHFADRGDGDGGEPSPDYQKPFIRDNFEFN